MPQPDNRRATGSATQTSQQVVGPQGQQSANISATGMGAAQVGPSVQIGQQAQIRDAGTALYEAISGAARGVQQGIQNYEDMYKMVSERDYANFETEYVKQSELVKGDRQKMRAWLSNNTYQPNRVTAKRYWNLHADVNLKAYEEDQLDILRDFSFRTKDLLPDDKMNEMEQMLKQLDPESPAAMSIEQDLVKLSQKQTFENRRISVETIQTKTTLENEALVAQIKKNHGQAYNMFLSSSTFRQLLAARSMGVDIQIDPENKGITYKNTSYTFDSFDTGLMPQILDDMSSIGMSQGEDIYQAHIKAADLPRGLLGNPASGGKPSFADRIATEERIRQTLLNNPSALIGTIVNSSGNPNDSQQILGNVFDSVITAKPEDGNVEQYTNGIVSVTSALSVLDDFEVTSEKWKLLTPEGGDPRKTYEAFKSRYEDKLKAKRNELIGNLSSAVLGEMGKTQNRSLSTADFINNSAISFHKLSGSLSKLTEDSTIVTVNAVTGEVNRHKGSDFSNGILPANEVFAALEIQDSRVASGLSWASGFGVSLVSSESEGAIESNDTINMVRARLEQVKTMEKLRTGDLVAVDQSIANDFLRRAVESNNPQAYFEMAAANGNRDQQVMFQGDEYKKNLRSLVALIDGNDGDITLPKPSKARDAFHALLPTLSPGDRETLLSTIGGTSDSRAAFMLMLNPQSKEEAVAFQSLVDSQDFREFQNNIPGAVEFVLTEQRSDQYNNKKIEFEDAFKAVIDAEWARMTDAPPDPADSGYRTYVRERAEEISRLERAVGMKLPSAAPPIELLRETAKLGSQLPGQSDPNSLASLSPDAARPVVSEGFASIAKTLEGRSVDIPVKSGMVKGFSPYLRVVASEDIELNSADNAEIFDIIADTQGSKYVRVNRIKNILNKNRVSGSKLDTLAAAKQIYNELVAKENFTASPQFDRNRVDYVSEGNVITGRTVVANYKLTPSFENEEYNMLLDLLDDIFITRSTQPIGTVPTGVNFQYSERRTREDNAKARADLMGPSPGDRDNEALNKGFKLDTGNLPEQIGN